MTIAFLSHDLIHSVISGFNQNQYKCDINTHRSMSCTKLSRLNSLDTFNPEKQKEMLIKTNELLTNCASTRDVFFQSDVGRKSFLKLQIENTGSFSSAKMKVFISKSHAKTALSTLMCTFFRLRTRRIKYCRYYSIPLHDAMNVILKHRGFLNSLCFKVEITGSKLEENVRISHAIILQKSLLGHSHVYFLHYWANISSRDANERTFAEKCPCSQSKHSEHCS